MKALPASLASICLIGLASLFISIIGMFAVPASVTPANAFTNPCVYGTPPYVQLAGQPNCCQIPCPVADNPHNNNEQQALDKDTQSTQQDQQINQTQTKQAAAVGATGSSGQGSPGAGTDLSGGQQLGSVASSMASVNNNVAQFYFGDNSQYQNQNISGATPSNFTAAAQTASTAYVANTVFALQAEAQTEKDSKEVAQLAQQAQNTQTLRQDLGFANKVRAKLAEVMALRASLQSRIAEDQSKESSFHQLADQTADKSHGDMSQSTAIESVPTWTATPSQAPTDSATTTPAAATPAATQTPTVTAAPQSITPTTQQMVAAAQQNMTAAVASISQNPTQTANQIVTAYQNASGDSADKLRSVGLQITDDPQSFGLQNGVDQTNIMNTLANSGL